MKYTKHLLAVALISFGFSARAAQSIKVSEPGSLATLVVNADSETSLTLSGQINAADFAFLADEMPKLSSLNLKDATIADYSGEALPSGFTTVLANTLPPYALFGTKITSVTLPDNITVIGEYALASTKLTSITLPASVTTIERGAFASSTLTSVVLPATVNSIGTGLFKDCSALKSVVLSSLTVIPASTFANCPSLSNVSAPNVTSIGASAFAGCSALSAFSFNPAIKSIGDKAFYQSGLKVLDLNAMTSLTEVGNYAFANCKSLTSAILPQQLTNLGAGLFMGDSAMDSVTVSNKLTIIPDYTFSGAAALTDGASAVPSSVTSIGDYALNGWQAVEIFALPDNLESIGDYAMANWSNLKEIHAEKLTAVPQTGENVWENVDQPNAILFVDFSHADLFRNADQWKEFTLDNTSSVDQTVADAVTKSNIEYIVVDGRLVISSKGAEIVSTTVYDLSGRRRFSKTGAEHTVIVDTNSWTPGVYAVQAVLADGTSEAIKIRL